MPPIARTGVSSVPWATAQHETLHAAAASAAGLVVLRVDAVQGETHFRWPCDPQTVALRYSQEPTETLWHVTRVACVLRAPHIIGKDSWVDQHDRADLEEWQRVWSRIREGTIPWGHIIIAADRCLRTWAARPGATEALTKLTARVQRTGVVTKHVWQRWWQGAENRVLHMEE